MPQVRTRIAPSPTGFPHIGTIYQAMFDFTLAEKYAGQFINRLEDTDQVRLALGSEKVIYESLDWFGLIADEDPRIGGPYAPYRQSERLPIYQEHVQKLLDSKKAYYCFCTKERLAEMRRDQEAKKQPSMYDKHCLNLSIAEVKQKLADGLSYVVRMKIPENQKIKFTDTLSGEIEFDSNLIDHQVILKSDGFPTYHLAVVVDDYLMKVTHIFRGKEWIPSTPKHILLYHFLGWQDAIPKFTHLPLILNEDGQGKLSKRFGHTSVDYYKQAGFLPEAILNYLTNLVWNHPEGKEIYPFAEFQKAFDIDSQKIVNISALAPRFNLKKLEWINGQYIRQMDNSKLKTQICQYLQLVSDGKLDNPSPDDVEKVVPLIKERIKKLSDFTALTNFLWEEPKYDLEIFKQIKVASQKQVMEKVIKSLESLGKSWNPEQFEGIFRDLAKELNIEVGDLFQLIRAAVSGQLVTPPLFESIKILGEEKTLRRIKNLLNSNLVF